MKKFLLFITLGLCIAQSPQVLLPVYTGVCPTTTCDGFMTANSIAFGGASPVYVTGEYQLVTEAARTNFNLAQGHPTPTTYFGVTVYHNGARLTPDLDYGRNGFTVVLVAAAQPGDKMVFDYAYFQ